MLQSDARKRLREARYASGMSRRQLSEATGNRISETTIFKVEDLQNQPDYIPLPTTVYILAEALGLKGSDFYEEIPA